MIQRPKNAQRQRDQADDEEAAREREGDRLYIEHEAAVWSRAAPTPSQFREASIMRSRPGCEPLTAEQAQMALYGLGIAGEAGEVADEVKKHLFHGKALDRGKLLSEMGDVFWYLDRLLLVLGASMEDAMQANMDKLAERYPLGWDAAAQHYDHGDGR